VNATEPTAAPAPARFLDVLPVRGNKRQALEWCPHSEDFEHGEGFVTLTSDRDQTRYAVTAWNGVGPLLAFVFTKVGGKGTDKDRESYLLTCCRSGSDAKCDCRGHSKHGHCRHSDALETLFLNKWLTCS
jgi:hypothetical protein